MFQVVLVLVLLHLRPSLRLRVRGPAGTAGTQPGGLLSGGAAAGCRVLQTAELGVVAGGHRASSVRLASAHPLRAPLRTCHRGPDPQMCSAEARVVLAHRQRGESCEHQTVLAFRQRDVSLLLSLSLSLSLSSSTATGAMGATWFFGAMGGASSIQARHTHLGSLWVFRRGSYVPLAAAAGGERGGEGGMRGMSCHTPTPPLQSDVFVDDSPCGNNKYIWEETETLKTLKRERRVMADPVGSHMYSFYFENQRESAHM